MIIEAKLHIPGTKGNLITRPHLFQQLDKGLNYKLTTIIAPSGYGKSTLLSEWVATVNARIAWVSLDHNDDNIVQFWLYLIESLNRISPLFNEQSFIRYAGEDRYGTALITKLINRLHRLSEEIVILIDDFHIVEDDSIIQGISYLLENLPPHVHFYMASQKQLTLPLSRLRVNGHLNELGVNDLRFSIQETNDFFKKNADLSLNMVELTRIHKRTEGWAVGIQIVSLSIKDDLPQKNQTTDQLYITGRRRNVADYFLEEVFMKQSEEIQQFLLKTSILNRINAELSEAITGSINGREIISQLEKTNLFIVSLDSEQNWYRYHHLFQQFLQLQLETRNPEQVKSFHMVAANWLEENGFGDEALEHYLLGEGYEEVFQLFESFIFSLPSYKYTTLYKWLNVIPDDLLFKIPRYYLMNTASLFLSGNVEEATRKHSWAINKLERSHSSISKSERQQFEAGLDFLVAFRSFFEKDFAAFVLYSQRYLEKDPRGGMLINFGAGHGGYHSVWDVYVSVDHFRSAEDMLLNLLEMWAETENKPFYAHLCIDYGNWLYERNRLDNAEHYARQALAIGKKYDNISLIVKASLMIAQIENVRNHSGLANLKIDQLLEEIEPSNHPALFRKIELFQVQFYLKRTMKDLLLIWLEKSSLSSTDKISSVWMEEYYLFARILGLQGKTEEAMALTNRLLYIANDKEKNRDIISLTIYKSLLFARNQQFKDSFEMLEDALYLGKQDGYIRIFFDVGSELKKLLRQYIQSIQNHHYQYSNKESFDYGKQLLEWMIHEKEGDGFEEEKVELLEHDNFLTLREKDVLKHMNKGLSNKMIAKKLNVSLATIKTHINNLYRKLGVSNRVLALQKAQEMKLLK